MGSQAKGHWAEQHRTCRNSTEHDETLQIVRPHTTLYGGACQLISHSPGLFDTRRPQPRTPHSRDMTTPQNPQTAASSPNEPTTQPFLSLHTTVVLLTALIIGLVIGGLTYLTGASAAAAVIAGLTSTGASTPVLRTLIR